MHKYTAISKSGSTSPIDFLTHGPVTYHRSWCIVIFRLKPDKKAIMVNRNTFSNSNYIQRGAHAIKQMLSADTVSIYALDIGVITYSTNTYKL